MNYNERKLAVLLVMRDLEEAIVYDVWAGLEEDISYSAVGMSLLRLHRQGLLSRRGYPKNYEITERDHDRIDWLEDEEEDSDEDEE